MEKKWNKERLTEEIKKNVALLTQASVICGMLAGAVYWVNDQFEIADRFADVVAERASARIVAEIDPLTREEFLWAQDSIFTYYSRVTSGMIDILEVRMNEQDSMLYVINGFGGDLESLKSQVRMNSFKLDTLNMGLDAGFESVLRGYEQDSANSAYTSLQARYRFHQIMERIRDENAAILDELRDEGGDGKVRERNSIKRKRFKRAKFDSFPVKPH